VQRIADLLTKGKALWINHQALVSTGRWRDERSAKRYTHVASHEEWDRVDSLPTSGKSVDLPAPTRKTKVNQ